MPHSTSGFADVNGAKIYYEVSGEGQPLILLHAGVGDSRMWDDQIDAFAGRYRVIRYDARGYGKTEIVPGSYRPHEDLYGLMAFLGIERAFLLGCSMGGQAVIDFTLAHPEMVGALIPVCSAVSGFNVRSGLDAQGAAMEAAYERGDLDACAEILCQIWIDGPTRSPGQVSAAIRRKCHEMLLVSLQTPDGVGEELETDPPALDHLGEIHTPTLVITGAVDQPTILKAAELLATRIPGAHTAVIEGAAHVPNMEKPAEFNRLVLDFLGNLAL